MSIQARGVALAALLLLAPCVRAGVVNPKLSVIGQPQFTISDEEGPDRGRVRLDVGETEIVVEDYLNPYARGSFTFAYAEEGLELEEGYVEVLRGVPLGLALKLGKHRLEFGKLNTQHPHSLPFAERFGLLAAFLPGEESLNDTGLQASLRLPAPGELSVVATAELLQGDSFRRGLDEVEEETESRPAVLARLSAFSLLGERSGLELGLSATEGTNNVAAGTRTRVLGADAKAKLWRGERAYLLLQAEAMALHREDASLDPDTGHYAHDTVDPWGWYAFADYNFALRWNLGASFERFQQDDANKDWNASVGLFAGFAVMEETTLLRLDWRRVQPATSPGEESHDAVNTLTLRIIYSMGPHKAHQF